MTDPADTIRRYIQKSYPPPADQWAGKFPGADANDALTALLAERQQAIDALREIAATDELQPIFGASQFQALQRIARAALLNLGEQDATEA